ncbi:MAG TPA: hypothetical protein VFS71_01565 [Flavobacterium sp.]|uniref:hypothetical protein n=1 Tax=Flavobacterium sp. TaxID=239 RepID=UPI002DB8FC2B|nr:hypothetical protein [Flavobacterium sp.]HEU4788351.1 hypothetical protein [Flavobacterium sp.]
MKKVTKKYSWAYYCFFSIHESSISSLNIFKDKIIEQIFPIVTPAARVSHSTPGSLPTANAQILIVILSLKI